MATGTSYLERVIASTNIISPTAFSVAGDVTRISTFNDARQQASALVNVLQDVLYDHAYSRELTEPPVVVEDAEPDSALVRALRRANASRNRWDRGWWIEPPGDADQFVVRKKRKARLVRPGEFMLDDPYIWPPSFGASVRLRVPRDARHLQTGFYFAFGETAPPPGASFDLVRLYWNVQLAGAPGLVHSLTKTLNRFHVPFRLKCLTIPAHYDRVDAAVLFVQKRYFPITAQVVADTWSALEPHLGQATPLFTLRLAPGLAMAENPADGSSFGKSRCRLLAEGLWDAHVAVADMPADRHDCVAERFGAAGLSLEQPHLDAGSTDVYSLPQRFSVPASASTANASYVETAAEIGAVLCRDAVWSGDRCTWFGDDLNRESAGFVLVYRSLGGNVYAGSAGIALFLAELARATGDSTFAAVARAGAEHTLVANRDTLLRHGIGFYTGITGVAHAVLRIGDVLKEQSLVERALALAATLPAHSALPATDVLSGWAGAAPAVLDLCARHPNADIERFAMQLGEKLLALAPRDASPGTPPLLTGFAHGAAGYAWALAELYAHTNDEPFRIAAQRFLEYERLFYDEAEQNWQDLRNDSADDSARPSFSMSWCNGAPGIALARVRTQQILNSPEYGQEAEIALLRTASAVHQAIRSPDAPDFSLGHGAAGLADVLLTADQLTESTRFHALVRELADVGMKRFRSECNWPCAVSGGENPGLLLGLAGTGYFYLRLADPDAVPSVLLT